MVNGNCFFLDHDDVHDDDHDSDYNTSNKHYKGDVPLHHMTHLTREKKHTHTHTQKKKKKTSRISWSARHRNATTFICLSTISVPRVVDQWLRWISGGSVHHVIRDIEGCIFKIATTWKFRKSSPLGLGFHIRMNHSLRYEGGLFEEFNSNCFLPLHIFSIFTRNFVLLSICFPFTKLERWNASPTEHTAPRGRNDVRKTHRSCRKGVIRTSQWDRDRCFVQALAIKIRP